MFFIFIKHLYINFVKQRNINENIYNVILQKFKIKSNGYVN